MDINKFLIEKGYEAIPITQNAVGHLLIHVTINGVTGIFILDTGAGGTVVDSTQIDHLKLQLQKENTNFSGGGAGGLGMEVTPSMGNKIEIGNYTRTDFLVSVMSLEHAREALAQFEAHEEFLGMIGADILKPGKAVIDYDGMMLYLLEEEKR